jgi:hypothetical protein
MACNRLFAADFLASEQNLFFSGMSQSAFINLGNHRKAFFLQTITYIFQLCTPSAEH